MSFDPILAEIRFGCGLSPRHAPARDASGMLSRLTGPDEAAAHFPIESFPEFSARMVAAQEARRTRRQNRGTELAEQARKERNLINQAARKAASRWLGMHLLRRAHTRDGLRERLAAFWADHFTTRGKAGVIRRGTAPFVESAIRPKLSGRFADLLFAAVTHPMMQHYLEQTGSMGPNSEKAARMARPGGLNENLAREVLELHTLGADGPYTQADVRELAELFTGLTWQAEVGAKFRKDHAEPGAETVLGRSYGGDAPSMADIREVLNDLAAHPATARHIARKLAVHFVSDTPSEALVEAMQAAYADSGGVLVTVYAAMLEHPDAWDRRAPNVRQPVDFIGAALRALEVPPDAILKMNEHQSRLRLMHPLALMGQPWERPDGPDGWPEADTDWITPQGVAARLQWAMAVPAALRPGLPDPRDFVELALGPGAPLAVHRAARAAENRWEGVGVVLASPAFQRM